MPDISVGPAQGCDPWPITWPCVTTGDAPALIALAQSAAQNILWGLSGRRLGLCQTTESYRAPCTSRCGGLPDGTPSGVRYVLEGQPRSCCRIRLAQSPVRAIEEVHLYNVTLDPTKYALHRGNLVRLGSCWPCDDECLNPPIEVAYSYGVDVGALGALAMGELACEILSGIKGADCRLPANVISITRQGVTYDLGDATTLFNQGRVGLPISDAFLRDANPGRLVSASAVYSPDTAHRVR